MGGVTPQLVSVGDAHPLPRMLQLSAVFMAMTFVVFVGYGLFAASVRARVMTWMRRTFATVFVALGALGWRLRRGEEYGHSR